MSFSVSSCSLKHILLDSIKNFWNSVCKLIDRYSNLLSCITTNNNSLISLDISWSHLNSYRDTTHLLLRELPARILIWIINLNTKPCCLKSLSNFISLVKNACLLLHNRNNINLNRCNLRWKHKSWIITMSHDNSTDKSCCCSPWSLVNIF